MKQKTEYVVTLTSGESLGSLTKREADKMIRDTPSKVIGVEKKVWRGEDGWFDLWAEDSYWVNTNAPEPQPVKKQRRI
tara:strand:- start:411 stop:644 length:234 start_codon:yes stop_codon:yes gene_type:complete